MVRYVIGDSDLETVLTDMDVNCKRNCGVRRHTNEGVVIVVPGLEIKVCVNLSTVETRCDGG